MYDRARAILRAGIVEQVFPAAVAEVGDGTGVLWREAFGRLTYDDSGPDAAPETSADTIFDLASLTKVVATTPMAIQLVERGALALDDCVRDRLPGWRSPDRREVTVRDLLSHSSGLPAHQPLFQGQAGRVAYERAICASSLDFVPRTASVYSDLGFMLMGFILEDAGGVRLDQHFDTLMAQMRITDRVQFTPPRRWAAGTAPTGLDAWRGRMLVGEVHDQNAWALDGVAGHAGLFGTAGSVGDYARHLLQVLDGHTGAVSRSALQDFIALRADVPGSSRALGWDTMLPTSSCGSRMSPRAFGHTGFTGTSLWIDPDEGTYVVLLTNRLYPEGPREGIHAVRSSFHEAVMDSLALATTATYQE